MRGEGMENNEIKEIEIEEMPSVREFLVVINYYGSQRPYVFLTESLENVSSYDRVYKIKIPYKDAPSPSEKIIKNI